MYDVVMYWPWWRSSSRQTVDLATCIFFTTYCTWLSPFYFTFVKASSDKFFHVKTWKLRLCLWLDKILCKVLMARTTLWPVTWEYPNCTAFKKISLETFAYFRSKQFFTIMIYNIISKLQDFCTKQKRLEMMIKYK